MPFFSLNRIYPKLLLLLSCFLVPLGLACLLLTVLTNRALLSQSATRLQNIHYIRLGRTEALIRGLVDDNRLLAETANTETFLSLLLAWRDRENHGGRQPDFHGASYQAMIDKQRQLWAKWLDHRNCHDLYLADPKGLVLFVKTGGEELGANLDQGKLSASGLAMAWRRGKEADAPVLIDFSSFAADGGQAAFIAYPVQQKDRGLLGVLICRLAPETIIEGMYAKGERFDKTAESYLAGSEFQFLGDMGNRKDHTTGSSPDSSLAYRRLMMGKTGGFGRFRDQEGHEALAAYNQLSIPDVRWYLISKADTEEITAPVGQMVKAMLVIGLLFIPLIIVVARAVAKTTTGNICEVIRFAKEIAKGDYNAPLHLIRRDEFGDLAHALCDMAEKLGRTDWLQKGRNRLDELLRGEHGVKKLAVACLDFFVEYLGASMGALYLFQDGIYKCAAAYGFHDPGNEGLVAEAGKRDKLLVRDMPDGSPSVDVKSDVATPRCCLACPFSFQGAAIGVLLLGLPEKVSPLQEWFLEQSMSGLGAVFNATHTQKRLIRLIATSKEQQRELARSLAELEEKNRTMERQREEAQAANLRLAAAQEIVEQKVDDLEKANRHKEEFLATMSHELRTPLNSILILSKILSENRDGALSDKGIELANTIHASGQSLLHLINEVLDLAKIDAGRMTISIENCHLGDLLTNLDRMFRDMAEGKNLSFFVEHAPDLPVWLRTDGHWIQQILVNLLNNACKFTEQGEVRLTVSRATAGFFDENNPFIPGAVAFMVADSGIGIAQDKQQMIFKPFRQAESAISRKYGGTGLGLAIGHKMAKLLGGFIHLKSAPGQGSVFTLIVPESLEGYIGANLTKNDKQDMVVTVTPEDDREQLEAGSKVFLYIESDLISARLMRDCAHEYGFQYLLAASGEEGLKMARFHQPGAILLNVMLPDMDGKDVLRRLQAEAKLAVIPVFLSMAAKRGDSDYAMQARRLGATGVLAKPTTSARIKAMFMILLHLIDQQTPVLGLITDTDKRDFPFPEKAAAHIEKITVLETLAATIEATSFDCLLLTMSNPDIALPVIISQLTGIATSPPLVVFAKNSLDAETTKLIAEASDIAILAAADEQEVLRLLAIFLHRAAFYPVTDTDGTGDPSGLSQQAPPKSPLFDRRLLLADNDLRHAFTLLSNLEMLGVRAVIGRDGEECLEKLKVEKIDAVLLDCHLSTKQDGLTTLAAIRANERFSNLPIILCGSENDRDVYMTGNANGFLVKPVSSEKLLESLSIKL